MSEIQTVETEQIAHDDVQQPDVSEAEVRARRHGWVPRDEFRGDQDKWVDAETFVKRGEDEIPILRERNRALERKLVNLEGTVKEFSQYMTKVEERAYKRAFLELKEQQRQAVAEADPDKFDAAERKMAELQKELREARPAEPKKELPPDLDAYAREWIDRNKWFNDDAEMRSIALAYNNHVFETEGVGGEALLKRVEKHMQKLYPEKFRNPMKDAPGTVGKGNETATRGGRGKTYADLPAEAKAACDRFVKSGLITKEQYLKDYDW